MATHEQDIRLQIPPDSDEGRGIRHLAAYCGLSDRLQISPSSDGKPRVSVASLGQGASYEGVNTVCKVLARESLLAAQLLGAGPEEEELVQEWLTLRHTLLAPISAQGLQHVHAHLAKRVFLVGQALTLADFSTFAALHEAVVHFPSAQRAEYAHVVRWYDYVQHLTNAAEFFPPLELRRVTAAEAHREALALAAKAEQAKQEAAAAKAAKAGAVSNGPKAGAGAASTVAQSLAGPAAGLKEAAKAGVAKVKQGASQAAAAVGAAVSSATAAAAAAPPLATQSREALNGAAPAPASAPAPPPQGKQEGKKDKKEKKEKKEKAAAPAPAAAPEEPTVAALDMRVGRIVEVGPHPNAESLYLEQIDVGEAQPRQVISGLVKFVPLEAMRGRSVVVLLNLKPAKMRDVLSYGMVMCASNAEHSEVEPLSPPEGAAVGERITFEGFEGEPEAQLNPRKKVFEKIQPHLLVDAEGVACYKGVPFQTPAGPITAGIKRGTIS